MITDGTSRQDNEESGPSALVGIPKIAVQAVARAMLKQINLGFEMETIGNEDLKRIGA